MKKLLLLLFLCVSCGTYVPNRYYNVVYIQNGNVIEYHDVTDLYYKDNNVYFTLDDGSLILLSGGIIHITPLELN